MAFDPLSAPITVYRPGVGGDPRDAAAAPPGIVVKHGPPLHPDDRALIDGMPCTSASRTLIDCAEELAEHELRQMFARALASGHLDPSALAAARERVEWRPSLAMLDRVIADFT